MKKVPGHIAIIMDGNGRWAKAKGLPRIEGHRVGVNTVERIVKDASNLGVAVLSIYAFSTENWLRPASEIKGLFALLKMFLQKKIEELKKNNIKLLVMGDMTELPQDIRNDIKKAVNYTSESTGMILNIALNYGGRREIVNAVNKIIRDGAEKVDEKTFEKYLYTNGLPDPDLLIRTSGESRISNFLLWQTAYSEFYTTDVLWPDFKKEDLMDAISEYQKRDRRYGGV
ncbi:MAG: isoprenyl transferase [Elusimicrobia bacterium]|nr:isoprenyl transferase [Elusimicrobiota bacterium]